MTMHYETSARKLHCADAALQEPDVINYSDVHRHNSRKIIAFTAPPLCRILPCAAAIAVWRAARRCSINCWSRSPLRVCSSSGPVFLSAAGSFFPQMRRPGSRRCGAAPICWPLSAS